VASEAALLEWQERLRAHGVEFVGPKEHDGIWNSVYFFDPNGIRLELTYQRRELTDADEATAVQVVRQWAREHGQEELT
jgi:catechol-2,3-dioxygenase